MVEEVGDKGKWVTIFLGDFVESTVIDAKPESTTLFLNKEYRSSTRSFGRADVAFCKVLVDIFLECLLLIDRQGVYQTKQRCGSGL